MKPPVHIPEKLGLWDRLFNRYRHEFKSEGRDTITRPTIVGGLPIKDADLTYTRDWVKYWVIDRLTGSVTVEMQYLD
jgi:hypothetical protein